jgi:2,4-dienoyl-CoA reductase-like NADH-dependent reductase (Old Yellow Enzyme family)/thioredoxin reductase
MPYDHLLAPIRLRGLELPNRVVFPAMATGFVAPGGYVTDRLIAYHVARVVGGSGLNVTEATSIHAPSAPGCFLNISTDELVPGLRRFTDAIHAAGGRTAVQLWQGGLAAWGFDPAHLELISPSGLPTPAGPVPGSTPEKIAEVVAAWGAAAARAVEAGFDAIEVHCAHNYSPHAFLSPALNQRTDEYGGSAANRARYPLAAIAAVRAAMPDDMPLLMRIDAQDDELPGGLTVDDVIAFSLRAREAGVDALDVSRGNVVTSAIRYEVPPIDVPRGFNVANAAAIRRGTGMVTIAVGRINDPDQAEEIIASGKADMVVVGRGQIADPEFVAKAAAGRARDIVRCVGCDQGCYDRIVASFGPITCLRNPLVGREAEGAPSPTPRPLRVLVAGGGVAGMEAALVLAQRGHKPVLVEASDHLGGQFGVAGRAPRKQEMADAAASRADQVARAGVEVRLGTRVTPSLVDEIAPEVVIDATGARPIHPSIPGADRENVTDAVAVLTGAYQVHGTAAVLGGGLVGLEVAEYLAERDVPVTVVEMLDEVGGGLGDLRKICVLEALATEGVEQLTGTTVTAVRSGSIVVEQGGLTREVPCDTVVLALGSRPDDHTPLARHCAERGIAYHVVGDAVRARRALDAIAEANTLARAL